MITDVVAILDSSFNQLATGARPVKATIKETAKAMEHPVETGATITDHRIILPVEIQLALILDGAEYRAVYSQLRALYLSATVLTVQTRAYSYSNLIIVSMPHDEDPDMFDTLAVAVSLKEVQFVSPSFAAFKVRNPKNSTTVDRGQQTGSAPPETRKSSVLASIFK